MTGTDRVVAFIVDTRWPALPATVQRLARLAFLDTLGAALAGTRTPVSRIAAGYAALAWPGEGATILLHGRRAGSPGAALANGYAANALDIDDCALYTRGHPGAQLTPTALALAESLHLDGAALLAGLAVGYEVATRAARIWHATHSEYQACGSWGSVACAAVAAHLLRLPAEQVWHALGIADYHAPNLPMMRDIDHPSMVKHGIGWGAMTGITAAQLAACGFTGIPSLFDQEPYDDWVADIGQRWILDGGLAFKEYACCAWDHAAMRAATGLLSAHGLTSQQIAHLRVEAPHNTVRLGTRLPATTEQAQFNLAWPLAVLLLDGEVGPDQILESRFDDPAVRHLVGRIELVESEECNALERLAACGDPRGRYTSRVILTLEDGRVLDSGLVEGNINYPQQGWDEERVREKFGWLSGSVLPAERVAQVLALVDRLDQLPDVAELVRLLA